MKLKVNIKVKRIVHIAIKKLLTIIIITTIFNNYINAVKHVGMDCKVKRNMSNQTTFQFNVQ